MDYFTEEHSDTDSLTSPTTASTVGLSLIQQIAARDEDSVMNGLWVYVSPFLLLLGLVGNIFCLIVLNSKRMKQSRCSFILSALACVDIGALYVGLLRNWIIYLVDLDIRGTSTAMCKIHTYLSYVFRHLSSWTLVLLAVERLVSVYAPFKAKHWCSKQRTILWWSFIVVVISLVNSPLLYAKELQHTERDMRNVTVCHYQSGTHAFFYVVWWTDFAVLSCIPFAIICLSNVLIVKKLRFGGFHRTTSGSRRHSESGKDQVGSLTFMLMLVCLVFLLTTMPIMIYFLVGYKFWFRPENVETAKLVYTICNLIYYTNSVVNFFLYCLGGSQFRQVAMTILCGRWLPRRGSQSQNGEGIDASDIKTRSSIDAQPMLSREDTIETKLN